MKLPEASMSWHNAVTRRQLVATRTSLNTVESWLRRGRLVRLLPGVYAKPPVELLTRVSAALLWLPVAAASRRTAAWLWQFADEPPIVEVTVPRRCGRRSPVPWLRLHRRDLPAGLVECWGRLPTVEPEQTVLDCLAVLDRPAGVRLVDRALGKHVRVERLRGRYLANLGRRGSPAAVTPC